MQLADIIIEQIKRDGPISFHDFMETALYYPGLGYYMGACDFGAKGDYFTSPYLTPVFGAMIARQLEEMWELMGKPSFTVVEYGAGSGGLCRDILNQLMKNRSMYRNLNYCIIERSPFMREKEKDRLPAKVSWHHSIDELSGLTGCVLSNELVDNFAVHRVIMEDELKEVYIDHQEHFVEVLKPAPDILKNYLGDQEIYLPYGYRTEINLEAIHWIRSVAAAIKRGYVLTIDYGDVAEGVYSKRRSDGTLLCYSKHNINDQPYEHIGEQDITAHVNFTALKKWGHKYGLNYCGLTNQACFLVALGFKEYLRTVGFAGMDLISAVKKEAFITRKLLLEMGERFKVLIQEKGIRAYDLKGLKMK